MHGQQQSQWQAKLTRNMNMNVGKHYCPVLPKILKKQLVAVLQLLHLALGTTTLHFTPVYSLHQFTVYSS